MDDRTVPFKKYHKIFNFAHDRGRRIETSGHGHSDL